MSNQTTRPPQRTNNNRPRNNNNRNRRNRNNNSQRQPQTSRSPKLVNLTLWQKILKVFGLYKPKDQARSGGQRLQKSDVQGTPKSQSTTRPSTPTLVESPRLYVGNLSYEANESEIEELFKGIGSVRKVEIIYNKHTHRSKGYGFIELSNIDDAKRAVDVLHNQPFMGRNLIVNGAKSKGPYNENQEPA